MTLVSTSQRNSLPDHLKSVLLPWEAETDLFSLFQSYHQHYLPRGPAETDLVEQLLLISWKRRRLTLAERAAHMAAAHQRASMEPADPIARRALCADPSRDRTQTHSYDALKTDEVSDIQDKRDIEEDRQMTMAAVALLEDKGADGYDEALNALRSDTREWWEDQVENSEVELASRPDQLLTFLKAEVLPVLNNSLTGINQRPLVRQQIQGESLDPLRLTTLHKMDERLARQFDQTLRTLERLQSPAHKRRK